jgi:hypothetical protein
MGAKRKKLQLYEKGRTKSYNRNVEKQHQKWTTFIYTGNYIRTIIKFLKNTNINIALKTTNTVSNLLSTTQKLTNITHSEYAKSHA